ncbi:hypothetical protein [Flavilitoribacter nigricans]|uniref:Uncharacterized protein n=1 Tax=Flavilitoribacter nigricans (strain ATCC 23147 / DSM 23189 / NBRC 102662 / NCIMB 1420 / SS-2) TaxID=1122177 RepID=A0A2D0N2A7_FLAN2|nr:hypothetical protein [Flavilitoribacter nigricans]PHN02682.1 hypothetical protein CRP01_31305 [Flavilitoribacter nigricans DSM 23189 = NBRC 102662]
MQKLLLLFGLFVATGTAFGQSADWTRVQQQNLVELRRSLEEVPTISYLSHLRIAPVLQAAGSRGQRPADLATAPVPAAWNYQDLAFFCKLEVKMEKALNLPVKFRLGEVQAVEKKEGKLKTHFADRQ